MRQPPATVPSRCKPACKCRLPARAAYGCPTQWVLTQDFLKKRQFFCVGTDPCLVSMAPGAAVADPRHTWRYESANDRTDESLYVFKI
jgi:hypothetical protein